MYHSRRMRNRVVLAIATLLASTGCVTVGLPAPEPGVTPAPRDTNHLYYHGKAYGSEAQFNPFTELLNEGFDQLRNDNGNRRLRILQYGPGAKNVIRALLHPDSAMRAYGVRKAITDELLPLSTKASNGGNWVPNYEFHLLGSGMVSQRVTEWFEDHHTPHPVAASFVTMFSAHFLNEALE